MDRSPTHRRSRDRARRLGATGLSAGLHGAVFVALLLGWRTVAPPTPQLDIPVSLAPVIAPPAPTPPAAPVPSPPKAKAAHAAPAPQPAARPTPPPPPAIVARRSPAPPIPTSLSAVRRPSTAPRASLDQLVDAQLAATRAEAGGGAGQGAGQGAGAGQGTGQGGGGGGQCDMAARVQAALRKDPLARAAVHSAGDGAIVVWNGDWVQATTEDGKGLAAVREAITFEVAFAPAACRQQRVRGPVLLTMSDGSARLTVGTGEWRWSDLLGLR